MILIVEDVTEESRLEGELIRMENKDLDDNSKKKLERIENQVHGSPTSLSVSGRGHFERVYRRRAIHGRHLG